jgi:hypothetical protein
VWYYENVRYQVKIYAFIVKNDIFLFNSFVLEFRPDLLLQIFLFIMQTYIFYDIITLNIFELLNNILEWANSSVNKN